MDRDPSQRRVRWRRARGWIAAGAIVALVGTVAVISNGFDAREVLREEPSVWVARDAGQYARVNTETGEIDTVRKVAEPSGVLQSGAESVVLTNNNGRAWSVDAAVPEDFVESSSLAEGGDADSADADSADAEGADAENTDAEDTDAEDTDADDSVDPASNDPGAVSSQAQESVRLPDGTRDVIVSGDYVLVRTESGAVYFGTIEAGWGSGGLEGDGRLATRLQSLQQIDPLAEEAAEAAEASEESTQSGSATELLGLRVDAIALSESGAAALYSASDGTIWRFDAARNDFVGGAQALPQSAVGVAAAQLSLVGEGSGGGEWALLNPETGEFWHESGTETTLELAGAPRLQASGAGTGAGGASSLIADAAGLWSVSPQGEAERLAVAEGTPAQPTPVGDERYAAWIGQNSGTLWSSGTAGAEERELVFDESASELGEVAPVFYTNGQRAVLGESRTGMLWTLPEGELIPLSQWTISDPPKEDQGTVVVEEVAEQVAPTAVDDSFGVREGEPAPLPVMLNDYDSNRRDVLTIVPESLGDSALPEDFGRVELTSDAQSLMVHPRAGANGTATFSYRVTDGTLVSEPATVTLSVAGDATNTAPAWCPVEGCQRAWAVPPIAPGGTLVYPILEGWVDPEGDPMMLAGVELLRPEDPATAIITSDGRLAVRHNDANAGGSEIMLRLTVRDARGAESTKDLQLPVQPGAAAEFSAMAATVQLDEMTVLHPLERVAGGSGSFQLVDVSVQSGAERVQAVPRTADGDVEVIATAAGEAMLSLVIRDIATGAEVTGSIRVTVTANAPPLTLPPLRAFVRPLSDSTVEILDAIPGASSRAISVQSATVVSGELRADVVEHSRVRVAGNTPDGGPGLIGSVDVTVSEGDVAAQGRLTVFQVPEAGAQGAVAVADSATVRAGSVVDIAVLENDVAAPGERLILHPEVTGSGTEGELAFASGSTLRYLAPEQPGTYRLSYTTYGASSPESGDVGMVTVNVLPAGSNQDPEPATVTVRVAPGEQSEVQVPLSGVDPDGDRVRLVGVSQQGDASVNASLAPNGSAIAVNASAQAQPGLVVMDYLVRDGEGGSGTGRLRVIVTAPSTDGGAPIASSDYVRVVRGAADPVVVRPLDNDIDPARGNLEIVSLVPNVSGGEDSPEYRKLSSRIDLAKLKQGVVSIIPGDELGTVSYRYTVKSSVSSSTADGLLLVQTSERVGAQAPRVTDTVLNVRERAELSERGVDVITDKVRWAAGDPSTLELTLWSGNTGGYRVDGNRIKGEYDPKGDLVAFRLSGVDASGSEVTSYGFLIIPPLDELRVTLKPGVEPLLVDENESVDAALRPMLDLTRGDRIEMEQGSFPVGRSQASCEAVSASEIRYTAGAEAPWQDTCLVNVRLVGQSSWTAVPIPVTIVPREPAVQLAAMTRTVSPGASETIDLLDMVQWQGGRPGDIGKLRFTVSGGGSIFEVAPGGTTVTVNPRADGVPGSQEQVTVSATGAGESAALLTLRVGEAPRDQPRGATVSLTCTVGSSCGTEVVGVAGEHDPFAGSRGGGLTLEAVNGSSCTFGTVTKASDRSVSVSWPENRGPGGRCTVSYTVRDAQGRIGEGSIEFDAQGVPRPPASIVPQSYSANSVTFIVELGAAQSAHPAVTGVEVSGAGTSACSPAGPASYQCVVSGLENGARHEFTARAVNSVGQSDPTSPVTAWAYKTPAPPEITGLRSIKHADVSQSHGVIEFSLSGDHDVAGYRVTVGGVTQEFSGRTQSKVQMTVPVGGQQFRVQSLSRFEPPQGGQIEGEAKEQSVTVAGTPIPGSVSLSAPTETSLKASVGGANANFADPSELKYSFTIAGGGFFPGQPPPCSTNPNDYGPNDRVFDGLKSNAKYWIRGCIYNGYGFAEVGVVSGVPKRVGGGTIPAPTGQLSFAVATTAQLTGTVRADYPIATEAAPTPAAGMTLQYLVDGVVQSTISHSESSAAAISVRQCFDVDDQDTCSDWAELSWSGAPTVVRAQLTGACVPVGDARSVLDISSAAAPSATATGNAAGEVVISWGGSFAGLSPVTLTGTPCEPAADPGGG